MLETLDAHLEVFIKHANDVRLDTTLSKHSSLCFEDVRTQASWMLWTSAYFLGARHAEKEMWENMK
jgi:hypothetical protein